MKILFLDPNKNQYNYYVEIIKFLFQKFKENFKICTKYQHKKISFILNELKWKPDIIIVGFSHTDTGHNKPLPIINDTNIKLYIILNKEYAALNKKLDFIKECNPYKCFTVHHDVEYFSKYTGIPFQRIMWSADTEIFKDYKEQYQYDLYFSGVIRHEQTNDWRKKIYDFITISKLKHNIYINVLSNGGKRISNIEYAKHLAKSKICLVTTGPADLVGTRYFEVMATNRCMILCNYISNPIIYDKFLINDFNCIMFNTTDEFHEKLNFYISNEKERMKIVNNAYEYFIKELSWEKSIDKINF